MVCCAGFPSGAACKDSCPEGNVSSGGEGEVCHDNSDCMAPDTCTVCQTPGGGPAFQFCVGDCSELGL
jgi:hypothetical protein